MNVLYEEEGEYKAGTVLSQSPASYQVESPHGRRSKIRAASVVFSFERPLAAELLAEARKFADGLDTDFLWQCRKGAEFGFQDLARDYVGHDPAAVEARGWFHLIRECVSDSKLSEMTAGDRSSSG